jgi:hypothetical protein
MMLDGAQSEYSKWHRLAIAAGLIAQRASSVSNGACVSDISNLARAHD